MICGKFANPKFRGIYENLNVHFLNTADESPWQNRLCKRNDAAVDQVLEKNHSRTSKNAIRPLTALSWAPDMV